MAKIFSSGPKHVDHNRPVDRGQPSDKAANTSSTGKRVKNGGK